MRNRANGHCLSRVSMAVLIGLAACSPTTDESEGGAQQEAASAAATATQTEPKGEQSAAEFRSPSVQAVEDAALARRLAEFGERTESPLALAASAQMLMETPTQPLEATPAKEGASGQADKGAEPELALTPAALLTRAQALATNDDERQFISGLQSAQADTTGRARGAAGGPQYDYDVLGPREQVSYSIRFRGGEAAALEVVGDGDTDLDCWVYAPSGALVDLDTDLTDWCILNWWVPSAGAYRVVVQNLDRRYSNVYELFTN